MKTNFISNLKQFLFLTLAVLGTLVGYSQQPQNPSIGGSKTPSTDPFGIGGGKSSDGGLLFDIGGTQGLPRDTGSGMIVFSLGTKTQCIFAYPKDIGGGGKGTTGGDTGQINDDDLDPYDIGGGKSSDGGLRSLYGLIDIGGKGTTGGGKGISYDRGQLNHDFDPYDIGGRGSFGTGTGTGEFLSYEIGGKNTPGDLGTGSLGTNPFDDSDDVTRGRDGRGTSTGGDYDDDGADTGGRNSSGTTGEYCELYSWDSQPD